MGDVQGLERILGGLMQRYKERVPDVDKILQALVDRGAVPEASAIANDHIAFRTIGVPLLGIQSLEKIFLHYGYERRDRFRFETKKLNAHWYSPPADKYPRVFISELCVDELSHQAQTIVHRYVDQVKADPVASLNLDDADAVDQFLHSSQWSLMAWSEYETLLAESEYAAWALYNRYYLNHFTISVHDLPSGYGTLEEFNEFLESLGVTLNDSGGKIKVSADGKLKQSSTVAQKVMGEFQEPDGTSTQRQISGSYVEFAERLVLDEFCDLPAEQIERRHRRDGFETQNADKIFESTYTSQTARAPS
ncbi:MAG: DUF1338 domain-containing protein [Planctomycetales bacterium]|nr:DUF1338 domain-containing protein [Planctomycetales bacterium]